MQLTKFMDYGLRVLVFLAVKGEERTSVAKIAKAYDISDHHVAKVASSLVHGGFVLSGRGRNGGLELAIEPDAIFIGNVLRKLAPDVPVAECFSDGEAQCRILPSCGLRTPLKEAQEAFFKVLDGYSLQDVTEQKFNLQELLKP